MTFRKSLLITVLVSLFAIGNAFSADFYWVGNSGNWNDASHWASTSGGAGGIGIPTQNDDVFFDGNASNSIIEIQSNISFHNLIITSNHPGFIIKSNPNVKINIYGSINVPKVFNNLIQGDIHFKSISNQTNLNFGWGNWNSNMFFESNSDFTFDSPLTNPNKTITLIRGKIILNGNDLRCNSFISNSSKKRSINATNSRIIIHDQWITNPHKFTHDLISANIHNTNNNFNAIDKGGENFTIQQSKGSGAKTITVVSIITDTASCGDLCDGIIIVNWTTTCPSASVNWSPGSPTGDDNGVNPITTGTDTIFDICPGIEYTAVITNSCDGDAKFPKATVLGHSLITLPIQPNISEPSCNGVCDGSISAFIDAAGFTLPFLTYQWTPGGLADTTTTLNNLCGGTSYSLNVLDGFGCDTTFSFLIPQPDSLYVNVTPSDPLCFGECSGTATSVPIGGTPNYNYVWTSPPALLTDTFATINNLCAGIAYTLTVTDAMGCINDTTIILTDPPQIILDSSSAMVSCGGANDGQATVTVLGGGTPSFEHHWSNGTIDLGLTSTITGLSPGLYCDTIFDGNLCDTIYCFNITEPPILATSTTTSDVTCNSTCNGTAITNTTGGTPGTGGYTYVWDSIPSGGPFNGQGTDSIFGLCPGTYFVTVTDNNSCSVSDTVIISEPPLLEANPSSTDITCPGFNDGTATVNPTGGSGTLASFTYAWTSSSGCFTGGASTQSISSLCPGTYYITVTDSLGCTAIDSVTISEPQPLNLTMTVSPELCAGDCNGTAGATVTGGTPGTTGYSYTWTPASVTVAQGQGTDSIFNLCPDIYTIIVTDSVGCSNNASVTVNPAIPIVDNLITTHITCNGDCNGTATISPTGGQAPYTVSWDGASAGPQILAGGSETITGLCPLPNPHTALITDALGCTLSVIFAINEPQALTLTSATSDPSCFGLCDGSAIPTPGGGTLPYAPITLTPLLPSGPPMVAPFTGLCGGTYYFTLTDDSLCTITDTFELFSPLEIFPNATFTNITCAGLNNGTASATPTGGVPPYTSIVWNTLPLGPIIPGNPIVGLGPNQYEVTVTDTNGCTGTETIEIIDPQPLTVSANATAASCGTICDGVALASASGGTGNPANYVYNWTGSNGPFTGNPYTGLCAGIDTVIVTDSMGCTASDTTQISDLIKIFINPTIITISCNGVCDGEATAFPSGGTLPYTYNWLSGGLPNNLPTVDSLCPGWAYLTVTDSNGCAVTDSVFMPVDPSVIQTGGYIVSPISCAGACDGVVTHSPSGGTPGNPGPGYQSVWTLPGGIDTNNVCVPGAIITVTDSAGCVASDTLIMTDPNPITPNDIVVDVLCFGDTTGSICVTPTGGTGGTYIYNWSFPVTSTGPCATGLAAGIYTVTILDSNGCSIVVTDTINEPVALSGIPIGVSETCSGLCDGMMTVIVNGGVGPFNYTWCINPPTTAPFDTIFNICEPPVSNLTNCVTITDSNGCQVLVNISINPTVPLNANVTGTPIGCNSSCDGTVLSSPTGGSPGYSYLWSTSVIPAPTNLTDPNLSNLCIGNYLVTVTDTNGCIDTASYTVTGPPPLNVTLDSTNVTCNGDIDGTATATPIGGTLPYSYSWVGPPCNPNPGNTATITNLCPGPYTVTVTDSNNCSFIGSVIITEPDLIDDNEVVTLANCNVSDGSICMFPSGGSNIYTHSWSTGATTPCITNLAAGNYTDTITDSKGCVGIFTISVTNPTGPSGVTATVNDELCYGSCDGSLNVIVIGGTAPYTYAWTGPSCPAQCPSDTTLTGLCPGTYNLIVTETSTGCILATSLVVGEADSITANSTFTDTKCVGACDGTASVTPTGGKSPYTFVWGSDGSTGSTISGLCAGIDSVTITDFNGCTKVVVFNISDPNPLTVISSITNPTCSGDCDGTATVTPSGGTPSHSYQWNDPLSQTGQTATGLCDGTYIVTVTDFNFCSINDTVTITNPPLIVANESTTQSTCGNSDGTASVCASSGGTGSHTYLWTTIPGPVNTCSVAGLAAGAYPVEITDGNGCMQSFLITISDINGPTVNVAKTNATCDGVCDGTATASATGITNFSYLWTTPTSPPQPTTPGIAGLCAGNYAVEVTDGNGCITTEPVTIQDNNAITATVSTVEPTCNGDCDGSALIIPTGGIPPYNYSWIGGNAAGQTINAVGGLCAGNYTVTITDFAGCSLIQNVTIDEPPILSVSVAGLSANCEGSCDGQATATPSGGTPQFTYLWSTGATTPTITALCAGNYTVITTDSKGCKANGSITIGDGVAITAVTNQTGANCGLCDGSITVSGGGGSGSPYNYLWSPGGQTSTTLNNLCPGAYQVDISDNLGCTKEFNILINNANGPTLTTLADSVTCFGDCDGLAYTNVIAGTSPFIFQWDDPNLQITDSATALCVGLYNVVVQDSFGCVTVDSVSVLGPEEILANFTFTPPTCPGACDGTATVTPTGGTPPYTVAWNGGGQIPIGASHTITGLCSNRIYIEITGSNGCSIIDSITLKDPTPISITISATTVTCNGDCDGTVIANASGGDPGYSYSWSPGPLPNNSLIGGLCPGWYTVTVTDNLNCTDTAGAQVVNPTVLGTISSPNPPTCNGVCDGSITTTPNGGASPYSYIWSNGDTTQTTSSTLCSGTYDVIVIDANNCTTYDTIVLIAPSTINDNTIISEPTCNVCDGSATSTPTGGSGTYNFVWTNLTAPTYFSDDLNVASSTAIALCAGTYNLEITDLGTGCIENFTIIVDNATGPALALSATDETCPGICDGTATAIPSGGTAPYLYSWTAPATPPTNTMQTATGLCVGQYTVTVTDSNNCISSDTISINIDGLNLSITSIVPETCFGDCDGSATVSVTGGAPAYTYAWVPTGPPLTTTPQALNLCVGNYVVTVTDTANCSDSISANISGPDILTVTASVNTPVSCNGLCDGAAIANVLGGTPNYQFSWNTIPVQTTQIATGLCAGTYIVTITDYYECTTTDTIILTEAPAIVDISSLSPPNCGACDGSIGVAPTGGYGPYTYLWTIPGSPPALPQPITALIINLCAGPYTLIITDTVGCSA
ncbi:MAG: hypothetical protein COB15_01765, partial [Flavobacteriales bacterium]